MGKKTLICAAMTASLALAGTAGTASAATKTVSVKFKIEQKSPTTNPGTYTGKPFGKGNLKMTEPKPDDRYLIIKAKGGTVTLHLAAGPDASGEKITGNWKATKGTGKFKKAKGTGTITGDFSGNFQLKGKLKY